MALADVHQLGYLAAEEHPIIPEKHLLTSDSCVHSALNRCDLLLLVLRKLQANETLSIGVVAVEQERSLLELSVDATHDKALFEYFEVLFEYDLFR